MIVRSIPEAQAELKSLVEQALSGDEIIIERAGELVARIVPYRAGPAREPGALRGRIHIAADFDELPPVIADAFGWR